MNSQKHRRTVVAESVSSTASEEQSVFSSPESILKGRTAMVRASSRRSTPATRSGRTLVRPARKIRVRVMRVLYAYYAYADFGVRVRILAYAYAKIPYLGYRYTLLTLLDRVTGNSSSWMFRNVRTRIFVRTCTWTYMDVRVRTWTYVYVRFLP